MFPLRADRVSGVSEPAAGNGQMLHRLVCGRETGEALFADVAQFNGYWSSRLSAAAAGAFAREKSPA